MLGNGDNVLRSHQEDSPAHRRGLHPEFRKAPRIIYGVANVIDTII